MTRHGDRLEVTAEEAEAIARLYVCGGVPWREAVRRVEQERAGCGEGERVAVAGSLFSSARPQTVEGEALPGTLQPAKMCGAPEGAAGARVEGSGHRPLPTGKRVR